MEPIVRALDYLNNGGLVMIPIILCSLLLWVLGLERIVAFRQAETDDLSLAETINMINDGTALPKHSGLRRDLVRFMITHQTGCAEIDHGLLDQYQLKVKPSLVKHINLILTLAAIAPLLGLLGTVSGMITTFDVISVFGTGNAKAMAGGISQSLITTQSGLTIAIPGMFLGVALSRRAKKLSDTLDETIMILKRSIT